MNRTQSITQALLRPLHQALWHFLSRRPTFDLSLKSNILVALLKTEHKGQGRSQDPLGRVLSNPIEREKGRGAAVPSGVLKVTGFLDTPDGVWNKEEPTTTPLNSWRWSCHSEMKKAVTRPCSFREQ